MAKFEPRKVPDDVRDVSYTDAEGNTHTLRPNDEGQITPRDAQADAVLEAHGFKRVTPEAAKPKASKSTKKRASSKKGKRDNAAIARKSAATRAARKAEAEAAQDATVPYVAPDEARADETRES